MLLYLPWRASVAEYLGIIAMAAGWCALEPQVSSRAVNIDGYNAVDVLIKLILIRINLQVKQKVERSNKDIWHATVTPAYCISDMVSRIKHNQVQFNCLVLFSFLSIPCLT